MSNNRIDVHNHYVGGVVARWFESSGFLKKYKADAPPWSVDNAIEFMDCHGIDAQVMSLPLPLDGDAGDTGSAARFAREVNETYATLIRDHPTRFGAFAALPMDSPDDALAEIG